MLVNSSDNFLDHLSFFSVQMMNHFKWKTQILMSSRLLNTTAINATPKRTHFKSDLVRFSRSLACYNDYLGYLKHVIITCSQYSIHTTYINTYRCYKDESLEVVNPTTGKAENGSMSRVSKHAMFKSFHQLYGKIQSVSSQKVVDVPK